jgi:hypothetical protein
MNLIHLKYIRVQETISPSTHKALMQIFKCIRRAPYIDEYPCKRRGGILWEDVKSPMVPYCRQVKIIVYFFCYCLPVAQFIFLRKRWMMPRHKIWVLLCTLWARIIRHKICVGEHQHVSGHHWAIQLSGKKEANKTFVFSVIRTHLLVAHPLILCLLLKGGWELTPTIKTLPLLHLMTEICLSLL